METAGLDFTASLCDWGREEWNPAADPTSSIR